LSEAPVIARVEGRVGRISLNRPGALNALTLAMCETITEALLAWRGDPAVAAVMLDHAGGRGFCAGGDIRALAADEGALIRAFFLAEYRLVELLHRYPKPTVVVMDGVAMGGGLGLAWPCRFRVATERTVLAMPEAAIGLFPDVGTGWRLPRLAGCTGLWMTLTGARLGPADAMLTGLATDYVPSRRLEPLKAGFAADPDRLEALLTEAEGDPGDPPLALVRDDIDRLFGAGSVEEIVAGLAAEPSAWARDQRAAILAGSPTTLKVAHRLLALGDRTERLRDEIAIEYGLAVRIAAGHDFREGVRARLVDRDGAPRWDPEGLSCVGPEALDALFAPLPAGEGWTPLP
jgi:enoyl-CoA hydratase